MIFGERTQEFIGRIAEFLRETYEHPCEFSSYGELKTWADATATALFEELGMHGEVSTRRAHQDGSTYRVDRGPGRAHYAFVTRWEPCEK